jgi:transposase
MKNKYLKKALMWHKVKELNSKGFNKSQISREIGICRKTVRVYLSMSELEFLSWLDKGKCFDKKLSSYSDFVKNLLEKYNYLSASQIEDRLKENYKDFPSVHSKTVYNFVQYIRKKHNISKTSNLQPRQYQKLPDTDYGEEAQVDFGEYNMLKEDGKRIKVYFFVMILSRSRQKYVYIQTNPFTTSTSIYAHQLAFKYFHGVPKKVVYDQDRVFMVDENLGDLILTQDFQRYVDSESFEAIFCRKADPESKGKVENVVKYVKYNFLQGREFKSLSTLQSSLLGWLKRTGNGKAHSTTKLVPQNQWEKEKEYLLPIKNKLSQPENLKFKEYKVLKDHTISYKGNFYSLPLGTYKNKNSKVLISLEDEKLTIWDGQKQHITTHTICFLKGKYIRNNDHKRDKSINIQERENTVIKMLGNTSKSKNFIELIKKYKPRFFNDNLRVFQKILPNIKQDYIDKSLDYCLEHNLYNANAFSEVLTHNSKEETEELTIYF